MTAKKLTTRARKAKASANEEAAKLLEALKFVAIAQKKAGTPYQTHCVIKDGYLFGFDGVVTVGTPLNIDLNCCPHTYNLMQALAHCGADLTITNETLNLTIKSGKYKSVIDCYPIESMVINAPDEKFVEVTDGFTNGLRLAAKVALNDAAGTRAILKSVYLTSNVIAATDSFHLIEYWHGVPGIPPVLLPKRTAEIVAGCTKQLTHIGGSSHSITFHFDDGSYVRSGLIDGLYPNYENLLAFDGVALPPPDDFFDAVKKVSAFNESGKIYMTGGKICSKVTPELGSSFDVDNIPEQAAFNSNYILDLQECFSLMAFTKTERGDFIHFFGDNVRGVMSGMVYD